MAGRSYEETVQVLLRGLKNAESQTRAESLMTLEKVIITQINRFFLAIIKKLCLFSSYVLEWVLQQPINTVIFLNPASYAFLIET